MHFYIFIFIFLNQARYKKTATTVGLVMRCRERYQCCQLMTTLLMMTVHQSTDALVLLLLVVVVLVDVSCSSVQVDLSHVVSVSLSLFASCSYDSNKKVHGQMAVVTFGPPG